MDIHYRPIEPADASRRTLAFINAFNAILSNHMWHEAYDDHDGYPGSDLCQENEAALFFLTQIIEENRAKDLQFDFPSWMYMLMGACAMYCVLHLCGVAP